MPRTAGAAPRSGSARVRLGRPPALVRVGSSKPPDIDAGALLFEAHFQRRASLGNPVTAEPPKEPIKEDLRLLIPFDVRANPSNEISQPLRSLGIHQHPAQENQSRGQRSRSSILSDLPPVTSNTH